MEKKFIVSNESFDFLTVKELKVVFKNECERIRKEEEETGDWYFGIDWIISNTFFTHNKKRNKDFYLSVLENAKVKYVQLSNSCMTEKREREFIEMCFNETTEHDGVMYYYSNKTVYHMFEGYDMSDGITFTFEYDEFERNCDDMSWAIDNKLKVYLDEGDCYGEEIETPDNENSLSLETHNDKLKEIFEDLTTVGNPDRVESGKEKLKEYCKPIFGDFVDTYECYYYESLEEYKKFLFEQYDNNFAKVAEKWRKSGYRMGYLYM